MTTRVAFYVQHLLGIGHVVRARRIAEALLEAGADVRLILGGLPVGSLIPDTFDVTQLPPIEAMTGGFKALADEHGQPIDDAFRENRRRILEDSVERIAPDVLIFEAFPFARRQMRFELIPLLERLHAMPGRRPLIVSSIRDILQERVKPSRHEESLETLNRFFDLVLVHGDPSLAALEETFPLTPRIEPDIFYTGIVAPKPKPPAEGRRFDIVVSAGGGATGRDIMHAALDAARDPRLSKFSVIMLTGPNLSEEDFQALQSRKPAHVAVERFCDDLAGLLGTARLSVSRAGYNTVADIIVAGCKAVLVPFDKDSESEQSHRADMLKKMGRVEILREADLSAHTLVDTALSAMSGRTEPVKIDADGAARSAAILMERAKGTSCSAG